MQCFDSGDRRVMMLAKFAAATKRLSAPDPSRKLRSARVD
jgi:hypothetical protein